MQKIFKNQQGTVAALFAIYIPFVLIPLLMFVVDTGRIISKKVELQSLAASAAEYGMTIVSDEIVNMASAKCQTITCTSSNPLDYITEEEMNDLKSAQMKENMLAQITPFINSQLSNLNEMNIQLDYPYESQEQDLSALVTINGDYEMTFAKIMNIDFKTIIATGKAKLTL